MSSESAEAAPGMRRGRTERAEDFAVRHVNDVVADELGWNFGKEPLPDYGVDAQAEVVGEDDLVTGQLLGLQIKGGTSYFSRPAGDTGWVFRDSSDHLAYWLGYSLPIVVVLVNSDRQAFWQAIMTRTVTEHGKTFSVTVPRSQPFDGSAREALLALVRHRTGVLDLLEQHYAALPPAAVSRMRRAEAADQLAAARLADRLADGRDLPGMTVASLLAARPSWIVSSPAAQELWLSVAAYAEQHHYLDKAAAAFELAAQSSGPGTARAWVAAGLAVVTSDPVRARAHLHLARDQGEDMLADIGFALLEVPEGDGRPVPIPESVSTATPAELDAEPIALMFLAEMATRRGELDLAVRYGERAVALAGDLDNNKRLALARMIHRRAVTGDMSSGQFRRALGHAQAAVEERRRWDGPSSEALAFLLDIHVPADMDAVIIAALPASEGGTAREAEAASPEIARRGALAALANGNMPLYASFLAKVPQGPHRRELLVLESEASGQPAAQQVEALTNLLDHAADDQMAVRVIAALAKLGHWLARAEELRDRAVLPQDGYDMLWAIYRARSGDLDIGVARLRELSASSALAACELIHLLAEDVGADSAITEAERQVIIWPNPAVTLALLNLLAQNGRFERAAELIERGVSGDSLPDAVRLKLANWYVAREGTEGRYAAAAAFAVRSLEIGEDGDLAWNLIKALHNDGKIAAARQALAWHRPEPVSPDEIRLWMQLHLGEPVTPDDALAMADMAQRQPDGELRDAIIALLAREVLLTPPAPGAPISADVANTVRQLADQAQNRPGSGFLLAPGDEDSLRRALEAEQPDPAEFQRLIGEVRAGQRSVADLARFAGRPYAAALLHRSAGILPAADLASGLRGAGEQAAEQAFQGGACVADLSSLYLLVLVAEDDRLRIRAALSGMIVARAAVSDTLLARDHMRSLVIATYVASVRADGGIERATLTPAERAILRERTDALEAITGSLQARSPASHVDTAADTIAIARENGLPLWCDDIALRQQARMAGVPAFSLLDLATSLRRRGTMLGEPEMFSRLAGQYVVDLPLTAQDIVAVAASHDWKAGPAHETLARPAWWQHHDDDWANTWLQIATEARRHTADALIEATKAALAGSVGRVGSSYRTQRYQQLIVQTLVACRNAGRPAPDRLLDALAANAPIALVPRPQFVLRALTVELQNLGVPNADDEARTLLPGVL